MDIIIIEETRTMLSAARSILEDEGYHLKEVHIGDFVPELNRLCLDEGEHLDALAFIRFVRENYKTAKKGGLVVYTAVLIEVGKIFI